MTNELNKKLNKLLGTSGVDYFAPSNFVRLIETPFEKTTLLDLILSFGFEIIDRNSIIYTLEMMIEEEYLSELELESVKYQAQQTEWKY